MNEIKKSDNLSANPEVLNKSVKELSVVIQEYFIENEVDLLTAFMILHNVHRNMIDVIAAMWDKQGVPYMKTVKMADLTFRRAMKDLWRKA